jgi:hypothetical protein
MRHLIPFTAIALTMLSFATAHAFEDEMLGTKANGRMERRDEAADRIPDPRMDYADERADVPPLSVEEEAVPTVNIPLPATAAPAKAPSARR